MSSAKLNANEQRVWIGLGANLGDAAKTFLAVYHSLADSLANLQSSSLYITRPFGDTAQGNFTNAVVSGICQLEPLDLLALLQRIERQLGKRKLRPNGPRVIDLDILFWGNRILNVDDLQIPHPRATGRDFVLLPMHELDPQWMDPVSGKSIEELLTTLDEHYFTGSRQPWPNSVQ
jgi:2-amino-4-hydroxy-6-hydroxymethyldihydropteridine diphosphokinase